MVVVQSPDEVLWRYLALRQKLGAPAARQVVVDRGLVFGDECDNCKAPSKEARLEEWDEKTRASRWMCTECDRPWPVDLKFLLRNEFQSSRRPSQGEELHALLATYSKILSRLLLREQRIYLLLYLYENVGGYEEVAKEANQRWPNFKPPYGNRGPKPNGWTKHTVNRVVVDARRRLNDELRVRHMKPRVLTP